jgi:hypothetical protein
MSYGAFANLTEEEFRYFVEQDIEKYFHIDREVWGTHLSGAKLRIDAVIRPKDTSEWANKDISFGVEFKSPSMLKTLGSQLAFSKQCIDYTFTKFQNYGFLPILMFPKLTVDAFITERCAQGYRHIFNQYLVGEMDYYEHYCTEYKNKVLCIKMADTHCIWANGIVYEGKRNKLIPKFGSK